MNAREIEIVLAPFHAGASDVRIDAAGVEAGMRLVERVAEA